MKRLLAIGIGLFLAGLPIAWSAGPSLPQILAGAGKQEEKKSDVVPDPGSLRADMWLYFNVPPTELGSRVHEAEQLLTRRYGPDTAGYDDTRRVALERIFGNLDAWLTATDLKAPELPAAPSVADRYTPAKALELVSALRKARVELDFEVNETAALQAALASTLEQVDRSMAAYLQMNAGSPQRLASGMDILAERAAAALIDQQLRVRRAALETRRARVAELTDAEKLAEGRLYGDLAEIRRLEALINRTAVEEESARQTLMNRRRQSLQPTGDTIQEQVGARFRQQQTVRADIGLGALRVKSMNLQAEQTLASVLADPDSTLARSGRQMLERIRQRIDQTRSDVGGWRAASERERDRAGERLSEIAIAESASASATVLLNQERLRLAQESINELRTIDEELTRLEFLNRWLARALSALEGPVARLWNRTLEGLSQTGAWFGSFTDRSLFKLGETPITLSGLGKVLVIVLLAWLISLALRRGLANLGRRFPKDSQALMFVISRLAHYLIIAIGVIAGLSSIGLNLTNFALVAGALALGLGFGLQSIVNNFLSGLILFFERSIKVGDFVELDNGAHGEVKAINVRGTIVNTNDNIDVIVPNSQFIERKVINWTLQDPFRRIHVPFRVAYDADEDKVVEAGLDAAGRLSSTLTGVLGREPSVWLVNYGENGLDFELIVWLMPDAVKRPEAVHAAYQWELRKALRRHDVEVPLPQREIRFRGPVPTSLDLGRGQ